MTPDESSDGGVRLQPDQRGRQADRRPVRVGISSCLLGSAVRFDGGHKRDAFLTGTFGRLVEWVPVCPEVECGLGTPRESMRLVRAGGDVRLLTIRTSVDLTDRMEAFARRRVAEVAFEGLSGYVLKKDSPSCGLERVKVYDAHGTAARTGRGLFASLLVDRFPALPVEEEGRLSDPRLRENFVARVFAYSRLRGMFSGRWTAGDVVRFHTAHKLMLLAHSPQAYRRLGRVVARVRDVPAAAFERHYTDAFMAALSVIATPGRHTNVLQHMTGYLDGRLDRASKAELLGTIEDYRLELVPLIVPITMLRHHLRTHAVPYLAAQVYMEPHPRELKLRNLV
jgi:uncharacterized protein YbgA (DUF1722 family)/uncharacterized protein YbbK (DUF523 family)